MRFFFIILAVIFLLCGGASLYSGRQIVGSFPEAAVKDHFIRNIDTLSLSLQLMELLAGAKKNSPQQKNLEAAFIECRHQYKKIESLITAWFPLDEALINGPDMWLPAEENEMSILLEPQGLQVIERLIYEDSTGAAVRKRKTEIRELRSLLTKIKAEVSSMRVDPDDFFEAQQMQVVRLFTLTLTQMETPFARSAFAEMQTSLKGIYELLELAFSEEADWKHLQTDLSSAFISAQQFLKEMEQQELPDYFTLYSEYYTSLSAELVKARFHLRKDVELKPQAINFNVPSLLDPDAFNTDYFIPGRRYNAPDEVAALGRLLFFDPVLSANNQRSCASCHQPQLAFTDGLPLSKSFVEEKRLSRNAPTLINSVLQRGLFHDVRAFAFENQASEVLNNPDELHSDFSMVAEKLKRSDEYRALFKIAFEGLDDTVISNKSVLAAIAAYERTLIGLNSRFDKTIRRQEQLMSADEIRGFNLFMGKADCGSCHFVPLFNGTAPPYYREAEVEVLGVPDNADFSDPQIGKDLGRYNFLPMENFLRAFKTPTLRNVALTGPYMHNGVYSTLEEVLEFYNRGGGKGLGLEVSNQTLSDVPLQLNSEEIGQIVQFLKTLTDTSDLSSWPVHLPTFPGNDELNKRVAGGLY